MPQISRSNPYCPKRFLCVDFRSLSKKYIMSEDINGNMEKKAKEVPAAKSNGFASASDAGQPQAEASTAAQPPTLAPAMPAEELEQLKAKAAKADEHWERLLRQGADFDNFKKRAAREKQEAIKFANEALLEKLISVLDHFDMALNAAHNAPGVNMESFKTGIALIYNQLKSIAAEAGLEELDATNQAFDPAWQEAVSHQETAETPENQVLQQLRKGYKLRDRLIRPAGVVVAKKPAA